jgi:hypothetical protein
VIAVVLALTGAVLLWRRTIPTHVAVPAVVTAYCFGWCVLGQLVWLLHLPLLTTRSGWWVGWAAVSGIVLWAGGRPLRWLAAARSAPAPVRRTSGLVRWAFLPPALFAVLGGVQSLSADLAGRWLTRATDPMQLVLLIQQMAREGALAYSANLGSSGNLAGQAYPKGLQWLITASLGPAVDPAGVSSPRALDLFLRTFAGFVWLSVALVLLVAVGLFLAAAKRWGLGPVPVLVATGCLTAMVVWVAQFGGVVLVQGAFASAVAVGCVWALWWVAVAGARTRVVVAVVAATIFVTANTWQPLVLVAFAAGIVLLWPRRGAILTRLRTSRPAGVPVLIGTATLSLAWLTVTASPVVALLLARGGSVADAPGGIQRPFLPAVVAEVGLAVIAVAWLRRRMRDPLAAVVVTVCAVTGAVWLAMVLSAGGRVDAYYPDKVLWFLTLFGWPFVALGLGLVTSWTLARYTGRQRVSPAPRRTATVVSATCGTVLLGAIALCWWYPTPPFLVAAATGRVPASVPLLFAGLPPLAHGQYAPYLPTARDAARTQEYEAAKILAFRFSTPYLPWGEQIPACDILRSRTPVVLVTTAPHAAVTRALHATRCQLKDWRSVQVSLTPAPVTRFGDDPHRRYHD